MSARRRMFHLGVGGRGVGTLCKARIPYSTVKPGLWLWLRDEVKCKRCEQVATRAVAREGEP